MDINVREKNLTNTHNAWYHKSGDYIYTRLISHALLAPKLYLPRFHTLL